MAWKLCVKALTPLGNNNRIFREFLQIRLDLMIFSWIEKLFAWDVTASKQVWQGKLLSLQKKFVWMKMNKLHIVKWWKNNKDYLKFSKKSSSFCKTIFKTDTRHRGTAITIRKKNTSYRILIRFWLWKFWFFSFFTKCGLYFREIFQLDISVNLI